MAPCSALGCCGSFNRTHHLTRLLLTPLWLRWLCGSVAVPVAGALRRHHMFGKQSGWSQERNNSIKCKGSTSAAMGVVHGHVTLQRLRSRALKAKYLLPAAQWHFSATTTDRKVYRNCLALRHGYLSYQQSLGAASPGQLFQWGAQQLSFC